MSLFVLMSAALLSVEFFFLEFQWINAQLTCTKKPDLGLHVVVSDVWSVSTKAWTVKPRPLGNYAFSGMCSLSSLPNSLDDQSFLSKRDPSMTGSLGSNTISVLWCLSKCENVWSTCSTCPCLDNARCDGIIDTSG